MGVVLMSCEPNVPTSSKVATQEATDITDYSARLHGSLSVDPDGYGHLYYGIVIAKTKEEIKNLPDNLSPLKFHSNLQHKINWRLRINSLLNVRS